MTALRRARLNRTIGFAAVVAAIVVTAGRVAAGDATYNGAFFLAVALTVGGFALILRSRRVL